jgi:hypothetical protein
MRGSMNDQIMQSYAKDDIRGDQSHVVNRFAIDNQINIGSTIPGNSHLPMYSGGGFPRCSGGISNNKHYINNTQRQIKFRMNQQPQGPKLSVQHSAREVYQTGISIIEQNTLLGQLNLPTVQQLFQSLSNKS